MARPSFDEYFMKIADVVAERATCPRKKVGAVIARNKHIIATGYNGAPKGLPHCDEAGCQMSNGHCVRTTHAEQNAVIQCALHGVSSDGATLYTTAGPCLTCAKIMVNAGIKRVVFREKYGEPEALELFEKAGVEVVEGIK
ncbi:MAG: cytidine/deoxycytidylate deaminase family protein [Candidatus Micrarchaeota archaeon]